MINSFKNYLVEEEKTVYFTFGRMNPPTIGHEKLIGKLASKAGKNPYRIYLSQTQDKKKNPLQYKSKIKLARKMFPKHARQIMSDASVKTVIDAAVKLFNEGFKNIVMVVGSDRITDFDILLNKYNGQKARHGFYNFRNINVVSAGERDPDSDSVEGMSASKMRKAASDNDFTSFSQGLPKIVTNPEAKNVFNQIRSAMGLKEQTEFKNHIQLESVSEIRENYINGMLYNVGDNVVIKDTGEIANVKYLGSNYVILEGTGNTKRKWLNDIEKIENKFEVASFSVNESLTEDKKKDYVSDLPGRQTKGAKNYYKGLKKDTKISRAAQFKKQTAQSDDDPSAYKDAPGDKKAREKGKVKLSKHTKRFRQMFGDD